MKKFALILCSSVVILCNSISCTSHKEKPKPKPLIPVKTAQAVQKTVPVQVKGIGTIEPFSTVAIKAQITGQISRIQVAEGSDVREGELLVSIDPEP